MARDCGAKNVYFASAAPPVRFPNVYGIDMPSVHELVAHGRTEEELRVLLGADKLVFQDLEDLIDAVKHKNANIEKFDCSVFTGEYVTQDVDAKYLDQLELFRNDAAKEARSRASSTSLDLHAA